MRRAWCLFAERADKRAYAADEIAEALAPALEQDCRLEVEPEFLEGLRRVAEEPSLFREDRSARFEVLRPQAGTGIGRAILDNVEFLAPTETEDFALVQKAVAAALVDRANKNMRSVEEHYLRRTSEQRAFDVRERLEAGKACHDFEALATRVLTVNPAAKPKLPLRKSGLDDGVSLR